MKVPFLGHRAGTEPVAWRAGVLISAAEFFSDAHALAQRLPSRAFAINLCRDRYCFAVGLAAAMMREQITQLPPTQTRESIREIRDNSPRSYLLVDDDVERGIESIRVPVGTGSLAYSQDKLSFEHDATAAIAFTSGSTGAPLGNHKTWGELARGGTIEAQRFGLFDRLPVAILGTVPPQHMFGLESTVMMPLQGGMIVHSERPFFPADIRSALAGMDCNRVLVTTPVHLRALIKSGLDLPQLELVVCATAPLSIETAQRFETQFRVEVHEVYGFTEAGMVATRRTADGPEWQLLPGLRLRAVEGDLCVSGGHVPTEVTFTDVVDVVDDAHFVLLGRRADIVNVAGKRTSIGYLNYQLGELEGVEDGVFFMPDDNGEAVTRLMAFAVAPGKTREQLLGALAQVIDAAFMPRPLHLVNALPRNATGKLPRQDLIRLASECAARKGNLPIVVETSISPSHPALPGHFPGEPIVPGVVLLDEIIDAVAREFAFWRNDIGPTVRSVKFTRPVRAGETLQIRLMPGGRDTVRFECTVDGHAAVSGALVQETPIRQ